MIKYCDNCKHIEYGCITPDIICLARVVKVHLVTGSKMYNTCTFARSRNGNCGPNAELFEQKVTLWQRVKQLMMNS